VIALVKPFIELASKFRRGENELSKSQVQIGRWCGTEIGGCWDLKIGIVPYSVGCAVLRCGGVVVLLLRGRYAMQKILKASEEDETQPRAQARYCGR